MASSPYLNAASSLAGDDGEPGTFALQPDNDWAVGSFDDDLAVPAPSPRSPHVSAALTPDLDEPEWARIKPASSRPPDSAGLDRSEAAAAPPFPAPPATVAPAGARSASARRLRPTLDRPRPAAGSAHRRAVDMRGGRWKIKAFRGAFFLALALLLLGGLRNIIAPPSVPPPDVLAQQVAATMGENGFPTAAAQSFALRFATVYLSHDEQKQAERSAALANYTGPETSTQWGWTGSGNQRIVNGPLIAQRPRLTDATHATITVAAQVTGGAWLYLAIPVYAANEHALVVSGPPAFVPAPALADGPDSGPPTGQPDDALARTLTTDVLTGYLTAWAASDDAALSRYITPDASVHARQGLAGTVRLGQIRSVHVPRDEATTRTVLIDVVWATGADGGYGQVYRLDVQQQSDGRWYIADLQAGPPPPAAPTG
jgi:hypothetical protein